MDGRVSFYFLASASLLTLVGSAYYLYKLFKEDESTENSSRLIDTEKNNLNKSNTLTQEKVGNSKHKSNKELGLDLYAEISKEVETQMFNYESQRREERIKMINNPPFYMSLVSRYILDKSQIFNTAKVNVLSKHNVSEEEFKKLTFDLNVFECEQALYKIYKPKFQGQYPPMKAIKKAYIDHCQEVLNILNEIHNTMSNPEEKNVKMLTERIRIDDMLYEKLGMTYGQLKFLLHHYDLLQDEEVKNWYNTVPS